MKKNRIKSISSYLQGFPYWGDGGVQPHQPKSCSFHLTWKISSPSPPPPPYKFLFPSHQKSVPPPLNKNFQIITQLSCSHCSCTIFVLISYSFDTQVVLILILIDVQYSQNAVFSFEKGLNCQNHPSSGSHHSLRKFPWQNFRSPTLGVNLQPSHPFPLFGKA